MAERRMFSKKIIDSDAFLDLPLSTQALYFHLSMRADDEGFLNNQKRIMRMLGSGDDEYKLLIAKGFLIDFDSGVVVVKHWRVHNYIQKDRFKQTAYTFERSMLSLKENGGYTLDTECIQDVRLGKDRLVEVSIVEDSIDVDVEPEKFSFNLNRASQYQRLSAEYKQRLLEYAEARGSVHLLNKLIDYAQREGKAYKDWSAAVRTFEQNDKRFSQDKRSGQIGQAVSAVNLERFGLGN